MTRNKTWRVEETIDEMRVVPNEDLKEHSDILCECHPKTEVLGNGKLLIIHQSFDGREQFEIDYPARQN